MNQSLSSFNKDYNEQLYFKMALLSQKLNHENFQYVNDIDSEELYEQAKVMDKVPFHKWYDYIGEQLNFYYWTKKKGVDSKIAESNNHLMEDFRSASIYYDSTLRIKEGYMKET